VLLLLVAVGLACVSLVEAFIMPMPAGAPLSSLAARGLEQQARPSGRPALTVVMSTKDKGSSKRRRRRASGGAGKPEEGGSGSAPVSSGAGARFDPSLTDLIEDERKSALPRLEDLKRGKEAAAKGAAALPTGGTPGILLPRELEELKAKEKAKEATKGAPPYFDLMTKASWAGIAILVIAEVVVQIFRTN
jgi:hypothetical protein